MTVASTNTFSGSSTNLVTFTSLARNSLKVKNDFIPNQEFEKINPELSWTHYNELIIIKDDAKRKFYEKECIN